MATLVPHKYQKREHKQKLFFIVYCYKIIHILVYVITEQHWENVHSKKIFSRENGLQLTGRVVSTQPL